MGVVWCEGVVREVFQNIVYMHMHSCLTIHVHVHVCILDSLLSVYTVQGNDM